MGNRGLTVLWDRVVGRESPPPRSEIHRYQPSPEAHTQQPELLPDAPLLDLRAFPLPRSLPSVPHTPLIPFPRQAVTNVLQGLAYFPVSLYIAMFARALSNEFTASIVLSLFNASASIGQIVTGHLTDRIPYPTLMAVSAVVSGIGAFVLWGLADATINLYLFAVVFGSLVRAVSLPCYSSPDAYVRVLTSWIPHPPPFVIRAAGSRQHGRTRRTSARAARRSMPGLYSTGCRSPAASR